MRKEILKLLKLLKLIKISKHTYYMNKGKEMHTVHVVCNNHWLKNYHIYIENE